MSPVDTFIIGFIGSFTGTLVAFIAQYYLHKKQIEELKKLKNSLRKSFKRIIQTLKKEE